MKCTFKIDTGHLSPPYDDSYEDLIIELSDEQFERLCKIMKELLDSKEYYSLHPGTEDNEWWLHKYLPDVNQKVREELEKQAPLIWDEGILPQLFNVDIYAPDEAWDVINEEEDDF